MSLVKIHVNTTLADAVIKENQVALKERCAAHAVDVGEKIIAVNLAE